MRMNHLGWLFVVFKMVFGFWFSKSTLLSNQDSEEIDSLKSRETSFWNNCSIVSKNQNLDFTSFIAVNDGFCKKFLGKLFFRAKK